MPGLLREDNKIRDQLLTLMAGESPGIRVGREHGERFRRALVEAGAFDRSRKIISDGSSVYLPILEASSPSISRLREIADFEIIRLNFESEEPRGWRRGYRRGCRA